MTCIVGIETDSGVTIGGDSLGASHYTQFHRADPKVFINGSYLIGYTTSFRMGQLLRYADLPKPLERIGEQLDRFIATDFVDAVRQALKTGGFAQKESDREKGGQFLVGVNGRLYDVDSDYQIGWNTDRYSAAGCGRDMALGALHAARRASPLQRVRRALEAAAYHNTDVCGPFTILEAP